MTSTFLRGILSFIIIFSTILFVKAADNQSFVTDDLRCCNLINPEGVQSPVFSWKIRSSIEGTYQIAWEIEIATTSRLLLIGKPDVWKSGKHQSDEQFNIAPNSHLFNDATCYFWRVRIWDNKGKISEWSPPAYFSTGLFKELSWKAKWITYTNTDSSALPLFRKVFNLNKEKATPTKAIVYICGLGCSELFMNGQKVDSTRFLDPAQTNYDQYAFYSSFDVTHLLRKGANCIGVMLGKGWFAQDEAWGGSAFSYGNPMLRTQMVVFYNDGVHSVLGSDESWTWKEGPVVKTNMYLGENYDARKELKGWCEAETPCMDWNQAILAKDNIPPRLIPQLIEPIRTKEVLKAVKMWQDSTGNWIFDFGVNISGIPMINIHQPAGTRLRIRIAEEKKPNGSLDFTTLGWIHHKKEFCYEYTCNGKDEEEWSPRFTYHGFRYAELSGMAGKPDLTSMSLKVVHTDVARSGNFECADPQVNKLHELAMRTVLSNLHGFPTDCPDREKCGWLGDSHAYVKMANLNLQMDNFWLKYLEDICSGACKVEKRTLFHERNNSIFYFTEKKAGIPYMIAPGKRLCGVASPDWGTALVQLPWWLYVYYGNIKVLNDYYPAMKQWTDYVSNLAQDTARTNKYNKKTKHIVYQGLGDWCPPGGNKNIDTPIEFTSSAFHYLDVCIMEKVAHLLAKNDDSRKYATEKRLIAEEVVAYFYNSQNKSFGSQTADAMALDFGLVPKGDEKAVSDAIVRNMNLKHEGFMNCGIFGLSRLGSMLARNGNIQAAWNMFTSKGKNSFEWMWSSADATSLWEVLPTSAISQKSAERSSHNHPMQAGYDVSFYEDIAGIRTDPSGYGFKVIRFEPLFTTCLSWAKARIESPYGTIVSNWKQDAGKFIWQITIPPNSLGLVALPKARNITVNGKKLIFQKLTPSDNNSQNTFYKFPSGNFNIQTWE